MGKRRRPDDLPSPLRRPEPLGDAERRRLEAAFKALADPSRLEVFRLLATQRGPVSAGDVVARVGLSQPTVSHHLKVLREAGLVRGRKVGIWALHEAEPAATVLLTAARAAAARPPRPRRARGGGAPGLRPGA